MEQQLFAISLTESIDWDMRNYESEQKQFMLSELKKGTQLVIGETWWQNNNHNGNKFVWELIIDELTDETLKFTFMDRQFTLNRYWQVLGTNAYGVPNAEFDVNVRFVFFFGTEQKSKESQMNSFQKLFQQMYSNGEKGNFWKNIPLAREVLRLMKDVAPDEDKPAFKGFCESVVNDSLLQFLDTPRLMLSFMDFWHVLNGSNDKWEEETNRLIRCTAPDISEDEKLAMIEEVRMVKYDPIQFSEPWEENIYEVELELEEKFKNKSYFMGFCHMYWMAKEEALAKRGIEWRSPQEMNPNTMFD